MATRDDRKAAALLLGLAGIGLVLRLILGSGDAPGAVLYRGTDVPRPSRDSVAARSARLARPLVKGEKIDLDRASAQELLRLPRVGPALAARIVADRDSHGSFGSLAELDRVSGVGPALLAGIEPYAVFSGRRPVRQVESKADLVRLNQASADVLAKLPGIGPIRAKAIVAQREAHGPYNSLADLARVKGIGSVTIARLKTLVIVP
ncbi:MAG: ComEA family DNA-binding protein [Gemmatimonadales bacterium]